MILLIGLFISISSLFYPSIAQAHNTGITHHETIFKYDKGHLIASYNLNLSYTDFKSIYPKVDQNQDGFISKDEAKTWLDTWKNSFNIDTNNQKLTPQTASNFPSKAELDPILFPILSFEVDFGTIDLSSNWQDFKITNTYRIGSDPNEYWATSDDQKSLEFDLQAINITDGFNILGRWKSIAPSSDRLTTSIADTQNNTTTAKNLIMFTNPYQNATNFLNQILKDPNLSLVTILILAILGLFIGAAHSLTPGHGKAIIGSYLAAVKGNFKDALLMALATTLSHTGSVLIVAFLFLWLKSGLEVNFGFYKTTLNFDLKVILPYFETISGVGIIVLGFYLLHRRILDFIDYKIRQAKNIFKSNNSTNAENVSFRENREILSKSDNKILKQVQDDTVRVQEDISGDSMDVKTNHATEIEHSHSHSHSYNGHNHTHHIPLHKINLKESLMLGFSTGLNPCVDAIAILILAINFDRIWLGIMILVSFSIGMALTLAGVGYAIGHGVKHGSKYLKNDDVIQYIPLISAVIIIILGVLTLVQVYR